MAAAADVKGYPHHTQAEAVRRGQQRVRLHLGIRAKLVPERHLRGGIVGADAQHEVRAGARGGDLEQLVLAVKRHQLHACARVVISPAGTDVTLLRTDRIGNSCHTPAACMQDELHACKKATPAPTAQKAIDGDLQRRGVVTETH